MRIGYFDCFSGISGDMILGAIVDAGLPLTSLKRELSKLNLKGYSLKETKVKKAGISATKVDVIINSKFKVQSSKKWKDIERIVKASSFSSEIKGKGLKIMRRLFEAEGKVHGESPEKVHLHELGAMDCIVDVFGAVIGIEMLGLKKVYSSPLNLGGGSVKTEHGIFSVPAPATAELLKNTPVYSTGIPYELTTPTGAAIITAITDCFMPLPPFKPERIGYGAGSFDLKGQPNILRFFIGKEVKDYEKDEVVVIETNIDDMNPQIYEYLIERIFEKGALDVYITQVIMKKGRPANLLTVLAERRWMDEIIDIIFKETTTFGVRFHIASRYKLSKEVKKIKTKYGSIRVKIGRMDDDTITVTPEYEDCKASARNKAFSLRTVMDEAKRKV